MPSFAGLWPRVALRLVPREWRDTVAQDLFDEAERLNKDEWWIGYQAIAAGLKLRGAVNGEAMWTDLRYALRTLLRSRWFAVGAVTTFAVGIGLNVAAFAAVDRLLLRPLPYADPDRLVVMCIARVGDRECAGSFPNKLAFEAQGHTRSLDEFGVAAFLTPYSSHEDPEAKPLSLVSVSPNLFRVLGVAPWAGRMLSPEEASSTERFAWLAFDVWRARYGSDPTVLGRQIWFGSKPARILGVLPKDFLPPVAAGSPERWDGVVVDRDWWSTISGNGGLAMPVARLRDGATASQAQSELQAMLLSLPMGQPAANGVRIEVRVEPMKTRLFARFQRDMWLVFIPAALLLAAACASLAGLLIARAHGRRHNAAITIALGASRGRVFVSALMETMVVCIAGGVVSIGVAWALGRGFSAWAPAIITRNTASLLDARVIGFAVLGVVLSCATAGLVPAWRLSRADVRSLLMESSASASRRDIRGRRVLLALQTAVGCVLVLGAALALRSLMKITSEDLGFSLRGLQMVTVSPVTPNPAVPQRQFYERAIALMATVPGVEHAGGGDLNLLDGSAPPRPLATGLRLGARYVVSPDVFSALDTPVLAGRSLSAGDEEAGAPVAVLSRSAAQYLWPSLRPAQVVGQTWNVDGEPARSIVGVVADIRNGYRNTEARLVAAYVPIGTEKFRPSSILARVAPNGAVTVNAIRQRLEPELGPLRIVVTPASELAAPSLVQPRFHTTLFAGLAVAALLLLAIGLYALASFDVEARRREIGIRLALGARPDRLRRRVVLAAGLPVVAGLTIGLFGGYWISQFVTEFLYHVDARDPLTYALVAAALVAVTIIAAWFPARRAARTDPSTVLRSN